MTFMVHWMDYREQQWKFFSSMEAKMNGQHYLSVIYHDINLQHKLQLQTLIKLCWCNCICQITSLINQSAHYWFLAEMIKMLTFFWPNFDINADQNLTFLNVNSDLAFTNEEISNIIVYRILDIDCFKVTFIVN